MDDTTLGVSSGMAMSLEFPLVPMILSAIIPLCASTLPVCNEVELIRVSKEMPAIAVGTLVKAVTAAPIYEHRVITNQIQMSRQTSTAPHNNHDFHPLTALVDMTTSAI